jgi:hypothetical protein
LFASLPLKTFALPLDMDRQFLIKLFINVSKFKGGGGLQHSSRILVMNENYADGLEKK